MNPVLITQGPLPAPGKYFSSPTETPGEKQGHRHIPGCPSLPCPLWDAHGHTHARMRGHPITEHVLQSRKSHGPSGGGAGAGQSEAGVPFTQLSLVCSQSRASEPPSIGQAAQPHTGRESRGDEPTCPPARKSFHSRPGR